jgi:hypothetical protein
VAALMVARHLRRASAGMLLILLAGCTTTIQGQERPVTVPLSDRPTSTEVVARYDRMQAEIRAAVTTTVPTVRWFTRREVGRSSCAEFPVTSGGQVVSLQPWGSSGGIPDDAWPTAVRAVAAAAAPYEFGDVFTIVDRPGDHLVQLRGPFGATIDFGTAVNVVLSITTGCHLE